MQEKIAYHDLVSKNPGLKIYEDNLKIHRKQFSKVLESFFKEQDPKTLFLFWIHFSSQGVGMTEPVEDWIRRAGNKCKILGYSELGEKLCKHAIHEADHQLMMIEDTKKLIQKWNTLYTPKLELDAVLSRPYSEAVLKYQVLHEEYIESTHPYCQIAIEYEIENLSTLYGPKILEHSFEILNEDIKDCLSFVDDHVKIDAAHTEYNRKAISDFLSFAPTTLNELMNAGIRALNIYGGFLQSCFQEAKNSV